PASDAVGNEDKARSANEVRASNAQTVESANAVSLSDGRGARLSALTSPIAGKAAPGSDPAQSAGDTGGLSAQATQSTVARFQPGIRRTCWQPAMNRRGSAEG